MSSFTWPCQEALALALKSTTQCDGRVYDEAPQNVAFPWIEIGDSDVTPDDTNDPDNSSDDGVTEAIDLHVWGRALAGKKEVKLIVDDIHSRLHGVDLAITGRRSKACWVRHIRIVKESDGITTHGIVSIEVVHRS